MSKLAKTRLESNVKSSLEKENESLIVYSLDVKGASKGTKNFVLEIVLLLEAKIPSLSEWIL